MVIQIEDKLRMVFSSIFPHCPGPNERRADLPEWDSLRHGQLIIEIQKEFNVELTIEDIVEINSFNSAIAAIKKRSQ